MGCEGSRSHPKGSPEWAITKIRKRYGFFKLKISEIIEISSQFAPGYVTQLRVNEIAQRLKVRLPNEMIRESMRDLRINTLRLLFTLVVLAEDEGSEKVRILKERFVFTPRLVMSCLEWRAELVGVRLVERAMTEGLIGMQEAKTFVGSRMTKAMGETVEVYQKLDMRDIPESLLRNSQLSVKL